MVKTLLAAAALTVLSAGLALAQDIEKGATVFTHPHAGQAGGSLGGATYKVVWRFGNELGAKVVSGVRRLGIAERDLVRAGSFRY
jgi:hypothetical protein